MAASYAFPLPSFVQTRGEPPAQTAVGLRDAGRCGLLELHNLTCQGADTGTLATLLSREDDLEIPGYLKIEAWPGASPAAVRITYDPTRTDESAIRQAIIEPCFDFATGDWLFSPFEIAGD